MTINKKTLTVNGVTIPKDHIESMHMVPDLGDDFLLTVILHGPNSKETEKCFSELSNHLNPACGTTFGIQAQVEEEVIDLVAGEIFASSWKDEWIFKCRAPIKLLNGVYV